MSIHSIPILAPIATVFAASIGWIGAAIKGRNEMAVKVAVHESRITDLEGSRAEFKETLVRMDGKIDRLVEHLLGKE